MGGAALVEYHRGIRRLSVNAAGCRDPRDRELLLALLAKIFNCGAEHVTTCYRKPANGIPSAAVQERQVDFGPVERFVRTTAVAIFSHEAALVASRRKGADDEMGWTALAEELELTELHGALKKCKPYDWDRSAKREAGGEAAEAEAVDVGYVQFVEAWWTQDVMPVLEGERRLALR